MKIVFYILLCFAGSKSLASLSAPNMSANALFLYKNSNLHKGDTDVTNIDQDRNGFNLREAELQFYSDVDPYSRLSLLLSVHSEYQADGADVTEKWVLEPEEAFIESSALSAVTIKLGKFKAFVGKYNTLHTHAYPFMDAPLANRGLLGDEGLSDVGVSAAGLFPTSWFSEVTGQFLRGEGENPEFKSPSPGDGVGILHWKNLIDNSDDLTMELGATYAAGGNQLRGTTSLSGCDLTFKWRPAEGGRYQSVVWSTEYLSRLQQSSNLANEDGSGVVTWMRYQFAERWAGLYRYDTLTLRNSVDITKLPNGTGERHSLNLAYFPSEFSMFSLEFQRRHGGIISAANETNEQAVFLQANFTIGAHPAHSY